jgi:hypothetical protein
MNENQKVLGLTETGQTVTEMPSPTDLPLGNVGQYYNEQVPLQTTFEKKAESMAGKQFNQNVGQVEQTAVRGATELQTQGQQMQTQLSLGEYMRDQSAEKAGWTGGYMLDQAQKGEYLKTTIQSQLYGAQELQKYGLESQLEAARLAYDLGKEQLALQYYNEAYQKALTEAQMFGYYVAPETRDMFNQYQAAITAKNANPDDANAQRIIDTVEQFYGKENLTPADIRTFSQTTLEMQQIMGARFDAAMAAIEDSPSKFLVKNEDGTYATDSLGNYITLDFADIAKNDLMTYLETDDGKAGTSDAAVRSYLRFLGQGTINSYFSSLGENETGDGEGFLEWLSENPNQVKDWITSIFGEDTADLVTQLGGELPVNLSGSKGSISATIDLATGEITVGGEAPPQNTPPQGQQSSQINFNTVMDGYRTLETDEDREDYLNNFAKDYKGLDGKKISWDEWYSTNNAVLQGLYGEPRTVEQMVETFIMDQEYISDINEGKVPSKFTGDDGWKEIHSFITRNVSDQSKDSTKTFIKNLINKVTEIPVDSIEITDFNSYPAIKIKGTATLNWINDDQVVNQNNKYVLYSQESTLFNLRDDRTKGYVINGLGVNNLRFPSGSGLNDKWLGTGTNDFAFLLSKLFSMYNRKE